MGGTYSKKCKEVFKKMDLFSTPEFLKHKGEGSYQTYTGATISVIIFILFTIVFFNYCKQTINREKIIVIPKTKPNLGTSFKTNQSSSAFMFGVGIEGISLADQQRFFDIYMATKAQKNGVEVSSQRVPLEPCLPEQWENINHQFKKAYTRLNLKQRLCPPKSHNFIFQGKHTSQEFHYTKLVVRRCQQDSNKACASDEEFNEILQDHSPFKLSIYFANPVIDANEKHYLDYVLEDTNFFEFSDRVAVRSHIFFSEYEVNTDLSVYPEPMSDVVTERGITLNQRPVVSNFEVIKTDELVGIYLKKSDLIQQFDRSYMRFDVTFAYLGGLFGMVLMLFYGMRAFSEYAFEFQIGSDIFVYDDGQRSKFQPQKFTILKFPIYLLYCIITFFYKPAEDWSCFKFQRQVDECRQQVKQQLDVSLLAKRLIYFENVIELLMFDKLTQLDINNKMTIEQAAQKRLFYLSHRKTTKQKPTEDKDKNPSVAEERPMEQQPEERIPTEKEIQKMMNDSLRQDGDSDAQAKTDLGSKEQGQNMVQNKIAEGIENRQCQMMGNIEQSSDTQVLRTVLRNREYASNIRKSPQGPSAKSIQFKSSSDERKDEVDNKEKVYVSFFNLNKQKRGKQRRKQNNSQLL